MSSKSKWCLARIPAANLFLSTDRGVGSHDACGFSVFAAMADRVARHPDHSLGAVLARDTIGRPQDSGFDGIVTDSPLLGRYPLF